MFSQREMWETDMSFFSLGVPPYPNLSQDILLAQWDKQLDKDSLGRGKGDVVSCTVKKKNELSSSPEFFFYHFILLISLLCL